MKAREGGSFVACLGHLIIGHASLSRRSTVPTPIRDTSNTWALNTAGGRVYSIVIAVVV